MENRRIEGMTGRSVKGSGFRAIARLVLALTLCGAFLAPCAAASSLPRLSSDTSSEMSLGSRSHLDYCSGTSSSRRSSRSDR